MGEVGRGKVVSGGCRAVVWGGGKGGGRGGAEGKV